MKKISRGKYLYRGYKITNMGYHSPDRSVVWEAVDPKTQNADFHGYSKRQIKALMDHYFEKQNTDKR